MTDTRFHTAVLFLIYNRPKLTHKVFQMIREVRPARLYVAADGPRKDVFGDVTKTKEARDIIQQINWNCELKLFYRDENIGCKLAISQALDWFFSLESAGIVIEDDCLPTMSFFKFAADLLQKYQSDSRVAQICGTNMLGRHAPCSDSYHFSSFGSIWGWASWRRAWTLYDVNMTCWPEVRDSELLRGSIINPSELKQRSAAFERTFRGDLDTWDYQWIFTRLIHRMVCVIPNVNLVSNVGFGEDATHCVDSLNKLGQMQVYEMEYPLVHPKFMLTDIAFERLVHKKKNQNKLIRRILRWVR